jgi:phosphatidylserine/phosphatidylglycerophosphate/cardiolipin synthase-like enzyme
VIFRLLFPETARQVLTALKDHGVPDSIFKVQTNCHTKGILVDRKQVLLGNQKWSNDGVSVNRDASLLFDDEKLAEYFAEIFDHDWNNLARRDIRSERMPLNLWPPISPRQRAWFVYPGRIRWR